MDDDAQTQVIVIGAGPVGMAAVLELARFGVRSVVIERHEGTSWHPKTRNFNTRSMEIARGWGAAVYKRLRSIDTPPGWKSPIRFLSTATGREFGNIPSKGFEGPGPAISPAEPVMSSQDLIEIILCDALRASGLADVRFGSEFVRLVEGGAPGDTRAVVEVRDKGSDAIRRITGAALIAADGAASTVRQQMGIGLEGDQDLGHVVNCYFRAPIEPLLGERIGVLLFVADNPGRGVLQPLDARGRWLSQIHVKPELWSLDVFTKEVAREWVRRAVGVDTLEPEILSLGLWKQNATVAERLVQGRVVLCGDAAHQFPPTGGLGVNTGLQGMHNAMWKLALFVMGKAGWPLVETYHDERREVSQRITRQSLQNSRNVSRICQAMASGGDSGLSAEEVITASRRYGNHLGVEFGAAYASRAVIADGSTPPAVADSYSDYVQSATPGCRAPHVWLGRADAALSTHDLFGAGFTLLAGPKGAGWCRLAAEAAHEVGVRIDTYQVGGAGLQDLGNLCAAYGMSEEGAALIRPDAHVGWRAVGPAGAGNAVADALRQILARG